MLMMDVGQLPQHLIALYLQRLHTVQKELIALELSRTLHHEDEMVSDPAQFHFTLELLMPQAFSGNRILESILDNRLLLPYMALISASFSACFLLTNLLQPYHAFRETPCKLPRIRSHYRFSDVDCRQQTIARCGHRTKFRMVCPLPFDAMHHKADLLTRSHLRNQNIRINWPNQSQLFCKEILLPSDRFEDNVLRIDIGALVQLRRVTHSLRHQFLCIFRPFAFCLQLQNNGIEVGAIVVVRIVLWRLVVPAHPVEAGGITGEWDETQTMSKHFILDYRSVVVDEDVFNG